MNTKVTSADFYAPEKVSVEITIRDKTSTFFIEELTATEWAEITKPLQAQDKAQKAQAERTALAKLIARCVSLDDGSPITFEQAQGFRFSLSKKLQEEILELNGLNDKESEKAKNE